MVFTNVALIEACIARIGERLFANIDCEDDENRCGALNDIYIRCTIIISDSGLPQTLVNRRRCCVLSMERFKREIMMNIHVIIIIIIMTIMTTIMITINNMMMTRTRPGAAEQCPKLTSTGWWGEEDTWLTS